MRALRTWTGDYRCVPVEDATFLPLELNLTEGTERGRWFHGSLLTTVHFEIEEQDFVITFDHAVFLATDGRGSQTLTTGDMGLLATCEGACGNVGVDSFTVIAPTLDSVAWGGDVLTISGNAGCATELTRLDR